MKKLSKELLENVYGGITFVAETESAGGTDKPREKRRVGTSEPVTTAAGPRFNDQQS